MLQILPSSKDYRGFFHFPSVFFFVSGLATHLPGLSPSRPAYRKNFLSTLVLEGPPFFGKEAMMLPPSFRKLFSIFSSRRRGSLFIFTFECISFVLRSYFSPLTPPGKSEFFPFFLQIPPVT